MLEKLKKYQSNTRLGVLDQIVVSGGNFLTGLLLARWLGLQQFGVFTLLWMIVLLALSFNMAMITKPLLTLIAKQATTNYLNAVHTWQLFLAFAGGVLTLFIGSLTVQLGILNISGALLLGTALLVINQLIYDFYRKCFYATAQIPSSLLLDIVLYSWQITGMLVLYFMGLFTLERVLALLVVTQAICLLLFANLIPRPTLEMAVLTETAVTHIRYSGWLSMTALMQWFTANYFIIAAGGILGTAMVGLIRIVQQLIGLIHILFLAMENLMPTAAAKCLQEKGRGSLLSYLRKNTVRWALPFAGVGLVFLLFSPWVIQTFFKANLDGNYILLLGYLGLYVLVFISIPARIYFRTIEHTRPLFIAYLVGTVLSFLAAPLLLKSFGVAGFVAGLILVQFLMIVVYIIEYQVTKARFPVLQPDLN